MPRNDNYPDNIRDFDHDSRSPFFEPPAVQCSQCGCYKPDDEVFGLYDDDQDDERKFCDSDCHEDYCKEHSEELVDELLELVDSFQSENRNLKKRSDSAFWLAKNFSKTASILKSWRKDTPEHDECLMQLKKHNDKLKELQQLVMK